MVLSLSSRKGFSLTSSWLMMAVVVLLLLINNHQVNAQVFFELPDSEVVLDPSTEAVDCSSSAPKQSNNSTLLMLELTKDPKTLTQEERKELETSLRRKFNNNNNNNKAGNSMICDAPHFRRGTRFRIVKAGPSTVKRNGTTTVDDEMIDGVNLEHVIMVSAHLDCQNCDSHLSLLSPWTSTYDKGEEANTETTTVTKTEQCGCPAEAELRSLTEEEFGSILSAPSAATETSASSASASVSISLRQTEPSSLIKNSGVVEVKELQCPRQRFAFLTNVYLRLQANITSYDDSDLEEMKQGFVSVYNALSFSLCDEQHHRRILDARVDRPSKTSSTTSMPPQGRNLQQDTTNGTVYVRPNNNTYSLEDFPSKETQFEVFGGISDDYVLKLAIKAECRNNCSGDTTLFSNMSSVIDGDGYVDFSAQFAESKIPSAALFGIMAQQGRKFRRNQTSCFCSAPFSSSQGRAPTIGEFLKSFNGTVEDLEEVGVLEGDNQTTVEEIVEVKEVQCSANISQFKSQVVVALDGDVGQLTQDEKAALQGAFRESYNALQLQACDLYHRSILAVNIVPSSVKVSEGARRLQAVNSTSNVSPRANAALFQVIGSCRDCPITDSGTFEFFDDSFRRTLVDNTRKRHRLLLDDRELQLQPSANDTGTTGGGCICPIDLDPIRPDAPTEDEFQSAFDQAVTILNKEGVVTSVNGVSDIEACPQDTREISGIYDLSFAANSGLSDDETTDLIIDSFNALRVDACSSQVVDVIIQEPAATKSESYFTRQQAPPALQIEVISISEQSQANGAFSSSESGGITKDSLLKKMNEIILEIGSATSAEATSIDFVGPAVQCTDNRATYSVVLDIDFQTDFPFACPEDDDDDDGMDEEDDAIDDDDFFQLMDDDGVDDNDGNDDFGPEIELDDFFSADDDRQDDDDFALVEDDDDDDVEEAGDRDDDIDGLDLDDDVAVTGGDDFDDVDVDDADADAIGDDTAEDEGGDGAIGDDTAEDEGDDGVTQEEDEADDVEIPDEEEEEEEEEENNFEFPEDDDDGGFDDDGGVFDDDGGRRKTRLRKLHAYPSKERQSRKLQDIELGKCTAEVVAGELEDIFPYTYSVLAQELCDPLLRVVEGIVCDIHSISSTSSGTLRCYVDFRCSGACGEWMKGMEIYQPQGDPEFLASSLCGCTAEDGPVRAPLVGDHITDINEEFFDVIISNIRLA